MKQITAIVQPHKLADVIKALRALPHFPGYTVLKGEGLGHGHAAGGGFVATEDVIDPHPRALVLVCCRDSEADAVAQAIGTAAHTGLAGDGLVTIADLERVTRIRTGVSGEHAV